MVQWWTCDIGALKTIPTFFTFYNLSLILNIHLLNKSTADVNVLSVETMYSMYIYLFRMNNVNILL